MGMEEQVRISKADTLDLLVLYASHQESGIEYDGKAGERMLLLGQLVDRYRRLQQWVKLYRAGELDQCDQLEATRPFDEQLTALAYRLAMGMEVATCQHPEITVVVRPEYTARQLRQAVAQALREQGHSSADYTRAAFRIGAFAAAPYFVRVVQKKEVNE